MSNWQLWLTQNFNTIQYWAKWWSRNEWRELIQHFALWTQKNWTKFSNIPDGEQRIKFMQTWMKNTTKWTNSEFNKSISVNNLEEEWQIEDMAYEVHYDVIAEDLTDDLKDFIIDLNRRFEEDDVRRIVLIRRIYLTLQPHERVLYDLYFSQMLSLRAVAKKLQLPMSAVYSMINELKQKIKEQC